MRDLGEALAAVGVTVSCPLLPGHATDPKDLARTTWQDWEAAALAAFDDLGSDADRRFVCGLSMGASLGIRMANRRETAGLIALSPAVMLRSRLAPFLPLLCRLVRFRTKTSDIKDPAARARHPSYRVQSLAAAASLVDLLRRLPEEIRAIRVPLLVVAARDDHVIDPRGAQRLVKEAASEDKRLVWLEDSWHVVTVDRESERVRREVVSFVRRVGGI
jgi:carboxylesterase